MIVAIDGPAGSGKSTVAELVAKKLGALYLDTGAIYRGLTLKVIRNQSDLDNENEIVELAREMKVDFSEGKVYLDSDDVTQEIRSPEVDQVISRVAAIPDVRKVMVSIQRSIGSKSSCVVEGRDTTTVVFPQAEFKFYLDADFDVRVNRRKGDFQEKQIDVDDNELRKSLKKRDNADTNREVGALKKTDDAHYIDTTSLDIGRVVDKICLIIEKGEKVTD